MLATHPEGQGRAATTAASKGDHLRHRVSMNPWQLIGRAQTPSGGAEFVLYQRDSEFSLKADNLELMNSRVYGSEEAMARLGCQKLGKTAEGPRSDWRSGNGLLGENGRWTSLARMPWWLSRSWCQPWLNGTGECLPIWPAGLLTTAGLNSMKPTLPS